MPLLPILLFPNLVAHSIAMPTLPLLRSVVRCGLARACLAFACCAPWAAFAAAPAASAAAVPAAEAAAAQPPSILFEFAAILLPVAVVLGGLVAVLYVLRKRHGLTARDAPLSVLQILPIGPRERIVVLRTRSGRALAIGVSGQSLNLIAELDPADIAPATAASEATVASATVSASAAPTPSAADPSVSAERES
ncbi:flagellar biosynthetic protein FliO [Lysobacter sp. K5869]|uniref:FliO/MopB family protein n=1 Tax=Lysobacter sp. K5869 TaxID=2820808 RepID=UPI001C06062C|nr:flagellar biosynthetic protein FliO [Lysobacter sp. K5869]QWP77860.1 flagellar biosynthetic protein FliO [Lysobacter sp. K5869]